MLSRTPLPGTQLPGDGSAVASTDAPATTGKPATTTSHATPTSTPRRARPHTPDPERPTKSSDRRYAPMARQIRTQPNDHVKPHAAYFFHYNCGRQLLSSMLTFLPPSASPELGTRHDRYAASRARLTTPTTAWPAALSSRPHAPCRGLRRFATRTTDCPSRWTILRPRSARVEGRHQSPPRSVIRLSRRTVRRGAAT